MTTKTEDLADKVMCRLRVIEGLASILMENDSIKSDLVEGFNAQLDVVAESTIHEAISMLAVHAQDQLIELMNLSGERK